MANSILNEFYVHSNPSYWPEPRIYVVCTRTHNAGFLHGAWIHATLKIEEIIKEIQKMLSNSPIPDAEKWGEWEIRDFWCFGIKMHLSESLEDINAKAIFIYKNGALAIKLLEHYKNLDFAKDALENHYYGPYENELAFATEFFNELHLGIIPTSVFPYIDYEKYRINFF